MEKPKDSAFQPVEIILEAGRTYKWCACGRSKTQPFCDNSHRGTNHEPKTFEVVRSRKVWLCMCKRTKTIPYCDGSHNNRVV